MPLYLCIWGINKQECHPCCAKLTPSHNFKYYRIKNTYKRKDQQREFNIIWLRILAMNSIYYLQLSLCKHTLSYILITDMNRESNCKNPADWRKRSAIKRKLFDEDTGEPNTI